MLFPLYDFELSISVRAKRRAPADYSFVSSSNRWQAHLQSYAPFNLYFPNICQGGLNLLEYFAG